MKQQRAHACAACAQLELLVPLGDIHAGCVRVVRHTRRRLHEDGSEEQEERSLRVVVAPGAVDGTRYTFQGCARAVGACRG